MRKLLRWFFLAVVVIALAVVGYGRWKIGRQGVSPDAWTGGTMPSGVRFDTRGIPTIEGKSWLEAIETQGYVIASERLFQMDLMRKSAGGRLAEWFGDAAIEVDRRRKLEDWDDVAARAYASLTGDEREYLDAYTRGVNRFINDRRNRWGIEYLVLQTEPEPWHGGHSMLILLLMCEQLTASVLPEATSGLWLEHAGNEWWEFLYPQDHPWNQPMFGIKTRSAPSLPRAKAIPVRPIDDGEARALERTLASANLDASEVLGSNNWAWCGKTGCFLANDPHLGMSVPGIWFANRLRVGEEWVAGVSIPGLPGVTLGMNNSLAWAFTNVGEDVDDLVIEKVSPDGSKYLARIENGIEIWQDVETRVKVIRIRGGHVEEVTARFTHRGPLYDRQKEMGHWYSRQWLPLKPGRLRLPSALVRARNWEELNAALDQFLVPAQNVLMLDRKGNMGYRASGTGILRKKTGLIPQPAPEGEWLGFAPPSTRPRMLFYVVEGTASSTKAAGTSTVAAGESRFIATANERIWVDEVGHRWADEQRKERIRRALASRSDFTRADMEALQRDTESRYRKLLLDWVRKHADAGEASKKGGDAAKILERWARWNGVAIDDGQTFADANAADEALQQLCVERAKTSFMPAKYQSLEYEHWNRTAWIITMLEAEEGTKVFGLEPRDLATHLLGLAVVREVRKSPPYYERNRWASQHPFAKVLPVVGSLFLVDTPVQYGWRGVPRVEQPSYGASVRLVWDLREPMNSTWSLPVGQSGHIGSPHYHDLQSDWFAGKPFPVFDHTW